MGLLSLEETTCELVRCLRPLRATVTYKIIDCYRNICDGNMFKKYKKNNEIADSDKTDCRNSGHVQHLCVLHTVTLSNDSDGAYAGVDIQRN